MCTCPCTCGSKSSQLDAQHKEHVFHFLMGLNDSYGNIIGQILLVEPFPSVSKVCSLILQEEKRRSIGHGVNMVYPVEATTMYANNNNRGHQGHDQGFHGGKGGNSKKEKPICTYYGLTGQIADKCYKLHGYSQGISLKEVTKIWLIKFQLFCHLLILGILVVLLQLILIVSKTMVFFLVLSQIMACFLVLVFKLRLDMVQKNPLATQFVGSSSHAPS